MKRMKKNWKVFTLLLASFVFLCQFSCKDERTKWLVYENPHLGIKISYPSTWQFDPNYKNTLFVAKDTANKKADQFMENIVFVTEDLPSEYTTQDYLDENLRQISSLYKGVVVSRYDEKIDGKPAFKLKYSISSHETILYATSHIIIYNGRSYVLTGVSTDQQKKEYEEMFDKVANTIQIK